MPFDLILMARHRGTALLTLNLSARRNVAAPRRSGAPPA
jgi:hypothetical protein